MNLRSAGACGIRPVDDPRPVGAPRVAGDPMRAPVAGRERGPSPVPSGSAGPGSNSCRASAAAPCRSAARPSGPARASGASNSWRTTPNPNSCSRSLPRARRTRTPARSAMSPAACNSAVFPMPAGPPITTSPPAPVPAWRIASCIRRSSGSRSSNMSVRRPSTNPVFPPGQRQTQPPCGRSDTTPPVRVGVYRARGDRPSEWNRSQRRGTRDVRRSTVSEVIRVRAGRRSLPPDAPRPVRSG